MREISARSFPGIPALMFAIALALGGLYLGLSGFVALVDDRFDPALIPGILLIGLSVLIFVGLYKMEPRQTAVLSLFGKYVGTTKETGLRFQNPFYSKMLVSMRVRNFESGRLKVNDANGSPIEIAAIVVWEVQDSAEAVFNVDDYESFVQIQSESAIRAMASSYPYDPHTEKEISLRSHPDEISRHMKEEIQQRFDQAGIKVIEARISHLAYAPEIAQAMLQRQQAGAVIAARSLIVEGAVGMVESALDSLKEKGVIDLDEERRAAMVSNLLVVLCSDGTTQPVINAGSIY